MMQLVTYFVAGVIFSIGLVLGGMTQPQKIVGFLDVFGDWDPSLGFVMIGAVAFHSVTYRLVTRRRKPLMAAKFLVPKRADIDSPLVVGAALFGVGWGLGGYCPGPALVAIGALVPDAALFLGSTIVGHWLYGRYARWAQRRAARQEEGHSDPSPAQAV